jgi:hypothetical protein
MARRRVTVQGDSAAAAHTRESVAAAGDAANKQAGLPRVGGGGDGSRGVEDVAMDLLSDVEDEEDGNSASSSSDSSSEDERQRRSSSAATHVIPGGGRSVSTVTSTDQREALLAELAHGTMHSACPPPGESNAKISVSLSLPAAKNTMPVPSPLVLTDSFPDDRPPLGEGMASLFNTYGLPPTSKITGSHNLHLPHSGESGGIGGLGGIATLSGGGRKNAPRVEEARKSAVAPLREEMFNIHKRIVENRHAV